MCSAISLTSPEINFANAVYLPIYMSKSAEFNQQLDVETMDVSMALGARLIDAFYKHDVLKPISHLVALHHIITTVLAKNGNTNNTTVVPLVVHFDEHEAFIKGMDKARKRNEGKSYFEQMLHMLGSAATSASFPLSDFRKKGRYFIVAITTGTPLPDASLDRIGCYGVEKVPLRVLDGENAERLAMMLLTLANPEMSDDRKRGQVLNDVLFRIALADTAGLPGLISLLCQTKPDTHAEYVEDLHHRVSRDLATLEWSHHLDSLTTIAIAKPPLSETSVIEGEYTLRNALDSGTVLFDEIDGEIGFAPVMHAYYNAIKGVFNPRLLKPITRVMEKWIWQNFGKTHLLYLAATLISLKQEESRFGKVTLGTFLRHVQPVDNVHLGYRLLPSERGIYVYSAQPR
jgi:hypothetical protein